MAKTYFCWAYFNLDSMSPLRWPRFKLAENILCSHRKLYPVKELQRFILLCVLNKFTSLLEKLQKIRKI